MTTDLDQEDVAAVAEAIYGIAKKLDMPDWVCVVPSTDENVYFRTLKSPDTCQRDLEKSISAMFSGLSGVPVNVFFL